MKLPIARTAELIEQEADKELLVYDLRINKAYTLNETSKNVFAACNGKTSFDDLKRKYNYTNDLIYLTLDELKKNDLILETYASPFAGMNRREVIKKIGLTSVIALPVISGLIAPDPTQAASGPCPTNVCFAAGANVCAGCANRSITTLGFFSNNGTCNGSDFTQNNLTCPSNGVFVISNTRDARRLVAP